MNMKELREKSMAELEKLLKENKKSLALLLFDLSVGKVKNTSEIRTARRKRAKILTVLSEKKSSKEFSSGKTES